MRLALAPYVEVSGLQLQDVRISPPIEEALMVTATTKMGHARALRYLQVRREPRAAAAVAVAARHLSAMMVMLMMMSAAPSERCVAPNRRRWRSLSRRWS